MAILSRISEENMFCEGMRRKQSGSAWSAKVSQKWFFGIQISFTREKFKQIIVGAYGKEI